MLLFLAFWILVLPPLILAAAVLPFASVALLAHNTTGGKKCNRKPFNENNFGKRRIKATKGGAEFNAADRNGDVCGRTAAPPVAWPPAG